MRKKTKVGRGRRMWGEKIVRGRVERTSSEEREEEKGRSEIGGGDTRPRGGGGEERREKNRREDREIADASRRMGNNDTYRMERGSGGGRKRMESKEMPAEGRGGVQG